MFGRSPEQRLFVNVNDIELTPQTPQKPAAGFEARVAPIAGEVGWRLPIWHERRG
jgi:hypothetical protein